MPAVSKRQQRFMGAELARKRAGKKTSTDMSLSQLHDFASTSRKGLPDLSSSPEAVRKHVKGKHKK